MILGTILFGVSLLVFGLGGKGQGEEGRWVEATGSSFLTGAISADEAQRKALEAADQNASEKACGVGIQAESFLLNQILRGDFVHAVTYAHILERKEHQWKHDPIERPGKPPEVHLEVTLKARVKCDRGEPDPSYQVKVLLNQTTFRVGDPLILNVNATKRSWFTVLNFGPDDQVYVLYPNRVEKQVLHARDKQRPYDQVGPLTQLQIPSEQLRQLGEHYLTAYLEGKKKANELILVIATTRPMDILAELPQTGQFSKYGSPRLAATAVAGWLSRIPVQDRAVTSIGVEIHAR